jgi:hypothetical protein
MVMTVSWLGAMTAVGLSASSVPQAPRTCADAVTGRIARAAARADHLSIECPPFRSPFRRAPEEPIYSYTVA